MMLITSRGVGCGAGIGRASLGPSDQVQHSETMPRNDSEGYADSTAPPECDA